MKKIPFVLYLIAGFLITCATIYGYSLYRKRAGLPPEIKPYAEKNVLVRINDVEIKTDQDIEFIFSRRSAGETATFYVKTDEGIVRKRGVLVAFYSQSPFPVINLILGFFLTVMAFVVFLLRPQDLRARIFYWSTLIVTSAQVVNGGFYCLRENWFSYIPGILFYAFYPLIPTLLLHFSLTFLRPKLKVYDYLIYFPAFAYIIALEYLFFLSSLTSSIAAFRQYQAVFLTFRGFVVFYILISSVIFILSYRKAILEEQKAQIKWILYGLFFGVGPFIVMYQLPRILISHPFISEELAGVFFIFIPVAFTISIIRYKLMNIELVINRSLVYSFLTVFTISFYLVLVQVIHGLFSKIFAVQQATVSVIGALAVALAFNPARKKIQEFVDRSFFRISYDYKKSILSFNERAHKIVRQPHLVEFFLLKIEKTIPLHSIGLKVFSLETGRKKVLIKSGMSSDLASFDPKLPRSYRIFARRNSVMTELGLDFSLEKKIEEINSEMLISLPFRTAALSGFVVLGRKKSGAKFTGEDIELLLTMAETFALNLERIHLQEEVIYERAEKEKFDELNKLKTEFISNVSHEIRTPMSSIHGMSEILQKGKIKGKAKQEEILKLMAGECSRLSRFLHNILDYGKIEQDVKAYHFQKADISRVVEDILSFYSFHFQALGFSVKKKCPKDPVWLSIDPDAVKQALTNLIDNAIKYSSKTREIKITVVEKDYRVEVRIKDKGIGIPKQEYRKIFGGFYRVSEAQKLAPRGVGLGLKIVKHIMEAHGGDVQVESQTGRGSTFYLLFPR